MQAWAFGTDPDPIKAPDAKLKKLLTHCSTNTKIYSTKRKFAIWAKKNLRPGKKTVFVSTYFYDSLCRLPKLSTIFFSLNQLLKNWTLCSYAHDKVVVEDVERRFETFWLKKKDYNLKCDRNLVKNYQPVLNPKSKLCG